MFKVKKKIIEEKNLDQRLDMSPKQGNLRKEAVCRAAEKEGGHAKTTNEQSPSSLHALVGLFTRSSRSLSRYCLYSRTA